MWLSRALKAQSAGADPTRVPPPQTAFVILDEVIKMTNRRVNALEHVVIPRLENTIGYINTECAAPRPTKLRCPRRR